MNEAFQIWKAENVDALAAQLHKDYRAMVKAMHRGVFGRTADLKMHDHGWQACHKKAYFRQRAERQLGEKGRTQ